MTSSYIAKPKHPDKSQRHIITSGEKTPLAEQATRHAEVLEKFAFKKSRDAKLKIQRAVPEKRTVGEERAGDGPPLKQVKCGIFDGESSVERNDNEQCVPQAVEGGPGENSSFQNSVGKTFAMDLSNEVKDYVRGLLERFSDQDTKNPTLYEVKHLDTKSLETLLRFNDRVIPKGTTKDDLVRMAHDYMQNGCPPRCPKCKRGALRFSNGKKRAGKRYYWCPGSTTDGRHFYGCNFKADRKDIERVPWVNPQ